MTLTTPRPAAPALPSTTDDRILRLGLLSCLAYAGLGLLGFAVFAGFWPPPAEHLSASQIAEYFHDNDVRIRIGMVLMAACGPFYMVWSAALSKIIGRIEGPMGILSSVELLGGLLTGLVTFTPATIWATAAFRADERPVAITQMLYDFGWFFFDLTFVCSLLQSVALGTAMLLDRRTKPLFPAWVAWLCFLTAATYVPLMLMPFFQDGPFAWHGLISFWAVFVIFFLEIAVVTPYAYKAVATLRAETPTSTVP